MTSWREITEIIEVVSNLSVSPVVELEPKDGFDQPLLVITERANAKK